eukprot:757982-Hanusia_phi.AAC.2
MPVYSHQQTIETFCQEPKSDHAVGAGYPVTLHVRSSQLVEPFCWRFSIDQVALIPPSRFDDECFELEVREEEEEEEEEEMMVRMQIEDHLNKSSSSSGEFWLCKTASRLERDSWVEAFLSVLSQGDKRGNIEYESLESRIARVGGLFPPSCCVALPSFTSSTPAYQHSQSLVGLGIVLHITEGGGDVLIQRVVEGGGAALSNQVRRWTGDQGRRPVAQHRRASDEGVVHGGGKRGGGGGGRRVGRGGSGIGEREKDKEEEGCENDALVTANESHPRGGRDELRPHGGATEPASKLPSCHVLL